MKEEIPMEKSNELPELSEETRDINRPSDEQAIIDELQVIIGKNIDVEYDSSGYVKSLDLTNTQLVEVPKKVFRLIYLQYLILDTNQLSKLPADISQLKELRELHMDKNHLTSLPETLVELTKLTKLSIAENKLNEIPEIINNIPSLKILNISLNPLKKENIFKVKQTSLEEIIAFGSPLRVEPYKSEAVSPSLLEKLFRRDKNTSTTTRQPVQQEAVWYLPFISTYQVVITDKLGLIEKEENAFETIIILESTCNDYVQLTKNTLLAQTILKTPETRIDLQNENILRVRVIKALTNPRKQTQEVGKLIQRQMLQTTAKPEEEKPSLLGKMLSKMAGLQVFLYVVVASFLIAFGLHFYPGISQYFQFQGISLVVGLYFIVQFYSGLTLDRYAISYTEKALFLKGIIEKIHISWLKRLYEWALVKLQASMPIIITIIWLLAVKSIVKQSKSFNVLQYIEGLDIIQIIQSVQGNTAISINQLVTYVPFLNLLPSFPEISAFLFNDVTGVFFRSVGILTIFWAIYKGGYRVLLDPSKVKQRGTGIDKLDWYEVMALPLGIFFALISASVEQSTLTGLPSFIFQLGLVIGGFAFLIREKDIIYVVGLFLLTLGTVIGIGILITIPIPNDFLLLNLLVSGLIVLVLVVPGVIPRRLGTKNENRAADRNYPFMTLKRNIFQLLGQPIYLDGPRKQFWNKLTEGCGIDSRLPGFFAWHSSNEEYSIKQRLINGHLATLVFVGEGYFFLPVLILLLLVQLPVGINVVLLSIGMIITIKYNLIPLELQKLDFGSRKKGWKKSIYLQMRMNSLIQCEEGAITEIHLVNQAITNFPGPLRTIILEKIKLVDLRNNPELIPWDRLVTNQEELKTLFSLDIYYMNMEKTISKVLKRQEIECLQELEKLIGKPLTEKEITGINPTKAVIIKINLDRKNLSSLPENFRQLVNLQTLDLGVNHLTSLPESIGQLTNLRELKL